MSKYLAKYLRVVFLLFLLLTQNKKIYCFVFKSNPMQLMMYLGNDLIDSVPVNMYDLSKPGDLGKFNRQLKQKYIDLIQAANEQPEFLVINMSPANALIVEKH
jgi:hypothetical protein